MTHPPLISCYLSLDEIRMNIYHCAICSPRILRYRFSPPPTINRCDATWVVHHGDTPSYNDHTPTSRPGQAGQGSCVHSGRWDIPLSAIVGFPPNDALPEDFTSGFEKTAFPPIDSENLHQLYGSVLFGNGKCNGNSNYRSVHLISRGRKGGNPNNNGQTPFMRLVVESLYN